VQSASLIDLFSQMKSDDNHCSTFIQYNAQRISLSTLSSLQCCLQNLCVPFQGTRPGTLMKTESKQKPLVVRLLDYSSALKMEIVHLSEALVNFYQTTQLHIPEDSTI
jgi:hypothetical protein